MEEVNCFTEKENTARTMSTEESTIVIAIMVWLWYDYGMVMVWLWYGYGMVMVWLWYGYGMVMV